MSNIYDKNQYFLYNQNTNLEKSSLIELNKKKKEMEKLLNKNDIQYFSL